MRNHKPSNLVVKEKRGYAGGKKKKRKEERKEGKRPYLNKQKQWGKVREPTTGHETTASLAGPRIGRLNEVKMAKPGQTVLCGIHKHCQMNGSILKPAL